MRDPSYFRRGALPIRKWAHRCRKHLAKVFASYPDEVSEYVGEAEHQDGENYWNYFETLHDAVDDFVQYLEVINEP